VKVRFTIDRLIVDGMDLSALEWVRFEGALRTSIEALLLERLTTEGHARLTSGQSERERVAMPMAADARGAGLGFALGSALGASVWVSARGTGGAR
jgi:hypothetical protein